MIDTDLSQAPRTSQSLGRRGFLKLGAIALGTVLTPGLSLAHQRLSEPAERSLSLYNAHTGEKLKTVYWADGHYVPEALAEINTLLRDHRQDQEKSMDPALIDLLHTISRQVGAHRLHIISGYRSPKTNAYLSKRSRGVAKKSLHMLGQAVDFYVPGQQLSKVRQVALSLRRGGVGYYPKSNFLHVDTGRVRSW